MQVKIKKLTPTATIPTYGTEGAACFDLYADMNPPETSYHMVNHGTPAVIHTGLAFEVPEGHVMLVFSRSGYGFKHNTRLRNCTGIIDSDYRGEVVVGLTRDSNEGEELVVRHGDRIAQAMIIPIHQVTFWEVDELSDTARGAGGFGSTGA
jgi:dUTP pyrophosphatase